MARGSRARSSLEGLLRLLAMVAVAGGVGVGLGMALTQLSDDDELSAPAPSPGAAASTTTPGAGTTTVAAPTTPAATTATTPPRTTPTRPSSARVRLRVLGAILRPAGTASGRRSQRARLIMRVRAQNSGQDGATLGAPVLRVGSVRVKLDPVANSPQARFVELGAGEARSFTLRYELGGAATPKVTRDRRARLSIGTRSVPLRVRIGEPLRPPGESTGP